MKSIFIIIYILSLISCRGVKNIDDQTQKQNLDTTKSESIKIGNPFEVNGLLCQWEKVISDNEIILKLKNSHTNEILWEYSDLNYYENDLEKNEILINFFDNLEDLNFDGFKDFSIYSRGSNASTSMTNIYIFNNKTKQFEHSEELSDTSIEELDSINKTLITKSFWWLWGGPSGACTKKHYFDEFGKVIFTEIQKEEIEMNDTTEISRNTFEGYRRTEVEHFKNDFFPFEFKIYSSNKLVRYFFDSVTIDSTIYHGNKEFATDPYKIYTYRLGDSYISFLIKEDSEYFFLQSAFFSEDLFVSKNGIRIGISINDFNKILKIDLKDYSLFSIEEGSGIIYKFEFKDGLLQSIYIDNNL